MCLPLLLLPGAGMSLGQEKKISESVVSQGMVNSFASLIVAFRFGTFWLTHVVHSPRFAVWVVR